MIVHNVGLGERNDKPDVNRSSPSLILSLKPGCV
jgi:hypothetical protein